MSNVDIVSYRNISSLHYYGLETVSPKWAALKMFRVLIFFVCTVKIIVQKAADKNLQHSGKHLFSNTMNKLFHCYCSHLEVSHTRFLLLDGFNPFGLVCARFGRQNSSRLGGSLEHTPRFGGTPTKLPLSQLEVSPGSPRVVA